MAQEHLFLTVSQATDQLNKAGLNVSRDTVQRWCRNGRIPATKLPGGFYRIKSGDVAAILATPTAA